MKFMAILKDLHNVEPRFYCAVSEFNVQCRDDLSELNTRFGIDKS